MEKIYTESWEDFLQKSRYTTATKYEQFEQDHLIVSHEDIFSSGNTTQDVLINHKWFNSPTLWVGKSNRMKSI